MGKKRRGLLLLYFLISANLIYSQVGIKTEKPTAKLDVNGDLQIRGEFRAGTSTDNTIAAGEDGQFLMSQGPGLPPKWGKVDKPKFDTGDYVLKDTQFAQDRTGLELTTLYNSPITEGTLLTNEWSVIEGLTTTITTTKDKNRIMFMCQTVMQSPFDDTKEALPEGDNNWASALCAIFIGGEGAARSTFKLVAVRQGSIAGGHYPQLAFTLVSSYEDIPTGKYNVVVAYQRRDGTAKMNALPLYFGRGFTTSPVQVTNSFMNKSVIRVDVFEPEDDD